MPPNPVQNLLNALLDSNLSHPDRMIKFYKQDLDYFFSKDKSNTEYYISQLEKIYFIINLLLIILLMKLQMLLLIPIKS